jgi:RNA polymerase sigma-70 factor (ECF subfamily)
MDHATAEPTRSFVQTLSSEVAFRQWYERALPRVYGYVLGRCGSPELAEDVTQQAFIEAVRKPAAFRGQADPVTWICAIARHKLADHFRTADREARGQLRLVVKEIVTGAEDAWARRDLRADIEGALRTLPPLQRGAFVFRYLDDLSVHDVARLIGKADKATESLLARARENFRRAYGEVDRG